MDFVSIMYRYINKFLNSEELLCALKKVDVTNYSKEEILEIQSFIKEVETVIETIPNEIDDYERKRLANLEEILKMLEKSKSNSANDEKTQAYLNERYEELLRERERRNDGGPLYQELVHLLTQNALVNRYAKKMDTKEMLEFITQYISVLFPPKITQDDFHDLVSVGILEDKREALWRLAFNYEHKGMDFTDIVDYFIEKRDDYYLMELISAVKEDLNIDSLIDKIVLTKDKEFVKNLMAREKELHLFSEEEKDKYFPRFKQFQLDVKNTN